MAGTTKRALWLGTAIAVLTALVCLSAVAARDSRTITLSDLANLNSPLMSCESDGPSSSGDVLLWCSDPNSPHCIPAAPEPPRLELADRPDLDVSFALFVQPASFVLLPWSMPQADTRESRARSDRLERPPRA